MYSCGGGGGGAREIRTGIYINNIRFITGSHGSIVGKNGNNMERWSKRKLQLG